MTGEGWFRQEQTTDTENDQLAENGQKVGRDWLDDHHQ